MTVMMGMIGTGGGKRNKRQSLSATVELLSSYEGALEVTSVSTRSREHVMTQDTAGLITFLGAGEWELSERLSLFSLDSSIKFPN